MGIPAIWASPDGGHHRSAVHGVPAVRTTLISVVQAGAIWVTAAPGTAADDNRAAALAEGGAPTGSIGHTEIFRSGLLAWPSVAAVTAVTVAAAEVVTRTKQR